MILLMVIKRGLQQMDKHTYNCDALCQSLSYFTFSNFTFYF